MTSQSSSIEKSRRAAIMPLLRNTLKQKWTTGLLISIIMFFVFPLPLLMYYSNNQTEIYVSSPRLRDFPLEWANSIRFIFVPLLSVLAVVMSCVMLRYLHKKVAVDFYHSLPVKRHRLLANQLISGYVIMLVPTLVMLTAAMLVFTANRAMSAELIVFVLKMLGEAIVYSLVFYGLASLVGVVTGVTAVHLILTVVAIFIVPAVYGLCVGFCEIFVENMWTGWYVNESVLEKLSPALRFCVNTDQLSVVETIVFLLFAALLFAATFLVYRRYKSERAGNSVIFPVLGEVIKYAVIFPMTLAGGLLFYIMMDSSFWTVFGMVCGGLLTSMLANTILQKSAKAMFRGWKGLCVYAGAIAVGMIVLTANLFGINTNIPEIGSIARAEVIFDNNTTAFTFTDDETLKAVRTLYTKGKDVYRDNVIYDYGYAEETSVYPVESNISTEEFYDYMYISAHYKYLNMYIVFYPKFGIPIAKKFTVNGINSFEAELRTLLDSSEFSEQYLGMVEDIDIDSYLDVSTVYDYIFKNGEVYPNNRNYTDSAVFRSEIKAALMKDLANVGFDHFQKQSLGTVRASNYTLGEYSRNRYLPLNADMTNTFEVLKKYGYSNIDVKDLPDKYAAAIKSVTVCNSSTGNAEEYTDPDKIKEIIRACSELGGQYYDNCQLILNDESYSIKYSLNVQSKAYPEDTDYGDYEYEEYYTDTYTGAFILGKVPDFVVNDLS